MSVRRQKVVYAAALGLTVVGLWASGATVEQAVFYITGYITGTVVYLLVWKLAQ